MTINKWNEYFDLSNQFSPLLLKGRTLTATLILSVAISISLNNTIKKKSLILNAPVYIPLIIKRFSYLTNFKLNKTHFTLSLKRTTTDTVSHLGFSTHHRSVYTRSVR